MRLSRAAAAVALILLCTVTAFADDSGAGDAATAAAVRTRREALHRSMLAQLNGQPQQAEKVLLAALQELPGECNLLVALARLYQADRQPAKAREAFRQVVTCDGLSKEVRLAAADALVDLSSTTMSTDGSSDGSSQCRQSAAPRHHEDCAAETDFRRMDVPDLGAQSENGVQSLWPTVIAPITWEAEPHFLSSLSPEVTSSSMSDKLNSHINNSSSSSRRTISPLHDIEPVEAWEQHKRQAADLLVRFIRMHYPAEVVSLVNAEDVAVDITVHVEQKGAYSPPRRGSLGAHFVGVMAVQSSPDFSSDLSYLFDPRPAAYMHPLPRWSDAGISRAVSLQPGQLFIFPAHIQATRLVNQHDTARIVIELAFTLPAQLAAAVAAQTQLPRPLLKIWSHVWATPVFWLWSEPLLGNATLHSELQDLILHMEATVPSRHKSNKNGWQSSTDFFETSHPAVQRLRNLTYAAAYKYMMSLPSTFVAQDKMGRLEMHVHAAWACVNRAFASNNPHVHPHSTLSGVYYVSTGPSPGASLYLQDPRSGTDRNGNALRITPKAGMIVLFPSWLEHYVEPLLSAQNGEPRVAVAFNMRVQHREDAATRATVDAVVPHWHFPQH